MMTVLNNVAGEVQCHLSYVVIYHVSCIIYHVCSYIICAQQRGWRGTGSYIVSDENRSRYGIG